MKKKLIYFAILTFLMLVISSEVSAWGPITHMTLLDDIINDPRLNPDIKRVLQENLRYGKGGAMGPDLFYFSDSRFSDIAHYCLTNSLATAMLDAARKSGKSQNIAYAYGWIIHVASDPVGHQWVNSIVGGEYDPKNSTIKKAHRDVELSIDTLNAMSHNYTLSNMFYDGSYKTIFDAYKSIYGCDKNAPSIQDYNKANNLLFALLSNYSVMQRDPYKYNTPEYQQAYQESITRAIKALNLAGTSLLNYDLDSGLYEGQDGYTGDQKCKDRGQLDKHCTQTPVSSPGGDHPDDTVSVDSGNITSETVSLDSLYRLAIKKNKKWILWEKTLADANAEYEVLPSDASPVLRQEKLNKISDLISALNDPFNYREFTINNPQLSTEKLEAPDVAVLENGYYEDATGLINKWQEPVRTVTTNFNPEIAKNNPVMVIPSGGLYGLESSSMLKAQFAEYVKNGGTLIVFAQQHGYEFNILPVPQEQDGTFKTITGYGWTEDQSCLWNGTYVDTYHQMLSAISTSTVSANVDGYFTSYPSNSKVLLRRTANGQPAMIMYDYGLGKVIISSMFSDWGYAHSQATQDEIKLVRDMISWAKKPAQLPEIKPGETVSVSVSVTNNTTTDAVSVKFQIYNPDRTTLLSEQTISLAIPAGSSSQLTTQHSTLTTASLGIYHIDYELYDSSGILIQPQAETDSGRFVVSNPPSNPYKSPDFNFAVNSDSENYAYGSDAVFTVTVWNNSDVERTITASYFAYHLSVSGSPKTVTVPAHSSASFQVTAANVTHEGWLAVNFYDENNNSMAAYWKGIWMFYPSVNVALQTDKILYRTGEPVSLTLNLQNKQSSAYTGSLKIRVSDPSNASIYSDTISVSLAAGGTSAQNFSFALPLTAQLGFYTVSAEVYDSSSRKIGGDSASFEIFQSQISVVPTFPILSTGTNTIPFNLSNIGKIDVNSGVLEVSLKEPDGAIVYTGTQMFTVAVEQNTMLNIPVTIPSLKFGSYILTYIQSDETKIGKPTNLSIPNTPTIVLSFDKASYRIRETANVTVNLTNTGKFNIEGASVSVSVPDAGYSDAKTLLLLPTTNNQQLTTFIIPETIAAGQHDVNVTLTLPSGSSIVQNAKFTIPESSLEIATPFFGGLAMTAGDTINLTIENTGGVDTNYTTEKLLITDNRGVAIYQGSVTGSILAGAKKTLADIQIRSQTLNGFVFLNVQIKDTKTGKLSYLYKPLEIIGLTATLQVRTDKLAYLKTESITGISNIANGQFGIEGGSLSIDVIKTKTSGTGQFAHFLPKTGWASFNYPYGPAVAPDGSVYVADTYNHRIQKFDGNGNFITKWGSYGTGNGQFNFPFSIAVGSDGAVYVADKNNHRIQKFDSNGNFITKWGSYGSGDGQVIDPVGIAVGSDGAVYVAEYGNHRIQKFDSNGNFITKWGSSGTGNGQFNYPRGIAVGSDGTVYVADTYNHRIQKFDSNGNFITKWGSYCVTDSNWDGIPDQECNGQFAYPYGIAVGSDGTVYVADDANNRIQKFDSNGSFITKLGTQGSGDGQFYYPYGIAVGPDGSVYVADTYNKRIQKMTPVGGVSEKLFETTLPISQSANTTQDYTTSIGTLNATGKLYLNAELKNSLGQIIATSEYPFYIIEGNTVLLFNTDKKAYKPNETVTITGEVQNRATITASGLSLALSSQKSGASSQNIYNATFDVPASGSHPFTITATAGTEGTYTLAGKVTQNSSTLIEINDQYEVAQPKVSVSVTVPEVVGNDAFDINVEIKNEGKVEATIQVDTLRQAQGDNVMVSLSNPQTITIPAGETKVIQYQQQLTNASTRTYTFTFSGDINQTITKTVVYGLGASVSVSASNIYPEGKVAIPVTITNTGQLDETVAVSYQLSAINSQNKTYFIPKAGSVTDTLYYDLTEGSYQITASSQRPEVSSQKNFEVRKENKVDMTVTAGVSNQVSGDSLIPVTINLTNLGYNEINGSVQLSLLNGQGTSVWNSSQEVSLQSNPQPPIPNPYLFNINSSAIQPGDYTLKAELFNNSNQQIAVSSQPITIKGAVFQITQLPSYQTFTVGQEASFTFKVKNTGNQEGAFDLNLKAYDMIDSTRTEWLKSGEEKEIAFSFMLPEDLEEKDYFADYKLGDSPDSTSRNDSVNLGTVPAKGQVKYHVAGINLSVNATLDKQYYNEGETAHLTIAISSQQSAISQNLFARVNYGSYENQQAFTLTSASTLTFDIPLAQITGEKLFYGIYHESGRSIHLNSLYIYKAGDALTITTDKQVYDPGDVVAVALSSQLSALSGTMTLSGPNYEETFEFSGTAAKSFVLSSTMTAGTYSVSYQLSDVSGQSYSGSHPFDVNGIQVKVLECKNDKGKYASLDTINTSFTISSNTTMPAILKVWIVDPDGKYTSAGESSINLSSSEPLLTTNNYSLTTGASGIHRLVYGIYTGDMLLVSGSEAFDVGDAVLLGLSTDKTDYPENTVPVQVKVSMFGTVEANLELQLDGTTVKSESVSLNGFETLDIALDTVNPGSHTLKGILTAGGLKSTKETGFIYGSNLPDLTAGIREQGVGVSKDNTIQLTATVTNQGKTPSSATTISLYDNDSPIETKAVNALNSGESQEINFTWNVLGKAGEHTIKAEVDPNNSVIEFNEENNASEMNMLIPDVSLVTETDKDTYKIRQRVNINSFITNLTSAKTYQNLILMTSAKDPSGAEVFQKNTVIAGLSPSWGAQYTETWNTSGLLLDGTYTITQTITSDSQVLAQSSRLIALEKAPDFTLSTDTDYRKIKQGERATYTAYIEQINGWITEIALGIEGLPAGTSVSFSPGTLIPPGSALTVIITTEATTPGIHNLNLTAQGIDEGETVTHTLPLTLDVSGFEMSAEPSSKTIKQLETTTFDINLNSINGYAGEVSLTIDKLPFGIKASFDNSNIGVPGNAKLTVLTSKYARPGDYTLTVIGDDGLVKHKLNLNLVLQANPQISAGIITAQGPGPNNQAEIRAFNSNLQMALDLTTFDTKYGAYATGADIDGDGYDEIIVSHGPDPKNSATLKVFRQNGTVITEYTAFDTKYGLTLSSGDIDGDWKDEIIVGMGPDPKNPATMKILKYNGAGFTELMTQTVFDTKYGLNTAVGDVDGDGTPEIITAAGPGPDNPAIIKIWKKEGQNLSELLSFAAFDGSYGANIATGDIDGDGKAEIITGTGPDPKNQSIVRIFKADGTLIREIRPYDAEHGYGVFVSAVDVDGDGRDEIITGLGPGPQNSPWVKVFRYDGSEIYSFISYQDSVKYGVKVSKGNIGN